MKETLRSGPKMCIRDRYGCIQVGSMSMASDFPIDFDMASAAFYIQLLLKSVVTVSVSFIALFILSLIHILSQNISVMQ